MGKRNYFKCLYFQAWEQNMYLLFKTRFSVIIHFLHSNPIGFIILQGETSYFQNNQFKIIFPGRVLRFGSLIECQMGASNRICRSKFKRIFKFDCFHLILTNSTWFSRLLSDFCCGLAPCRSGCIIVKATHSPRRQKPTQRHILRNGSYKCSHRNWQKKFFHCLIKFCKNNLQNEFKS